MTDREELLREVLNSDSIVGQSRGDVHYIAGQYSSREQLCTTNGWNMGFLAGADWQNKQSPWVEIVDIPEEWKDGRVLDLWVGCAYGQNLQRGWYEAETVQWENNLDVLIPTHAKLSPPPPITAAL